MLQCVHVGSWNHTESIIQWHTLLLLTFDSKHISIPLDLLCEHFQRQLQFTIKIHHNFTDRLFCRYLSIVFLFCLCCYDEYFVHLTVSTLSYFSINLQNVEMNIVKISTEIISLPKNNCSSLFFFPLKHSSLAFSVICFDPISANQHCYQCPKCPISLPLYPDVTAEERILFLYTSSSSRLSSSAGRSGWQAS